MQNCAGISVFLTECHQKRSHFWNDKNYGSLKVVFKRSQNECEKCVNTVSLINECINIVHLIEYLLFTFYMYLIEVEYTKEKALLNNWRPFRLCSVYVFDTYTPLTSSYHLNTSIAGRAGHLRRWRRILKNHSTNFNFTLQRLLKKQ